MMHNSPLKETSPPIEKNIKQVAQEHSFFRLSLRDVLILIFSTITPMIVAIYTIVITQNELRSTYERRQNLVYDSFLDNIYFLHRDNQLVDSEKPWAFANARYRSAHRQWDKFRKQESIRFLKEKNLIGRTVSEVRNNMVHMTCLPDIIRIKHLNFDGAIFESSAKHLYNLNLACIYFEQVSLASTVFSATDLNYSLFDHSSLAGATFDQTSLDNVIFFHSVLDAVDFADSTMRNTIFVGTNLSTTKISIKQLEEAKFYNVTMPNGSHIRETSEIYIHHQGFQSDETVTTTISTATINTASTSTVATTESEPSSISKVTTDTDDILSVTDVTNPVMPISNQTTLVTDVSNPVETSSIHSDLIQPTPQSLKETTKITSTYSLADLFDTTFRETSKLLPVTKSDEPETTAIVTDKSSIIENSTINTVDTTVQTTRITRLNRMRHLNNISHDASWLINNNSALIRGLSTNPLAIAVDQDTDIIFVTDRYNKSVLAWTPSTNLSQIIVRNLGSPTDILINKEDDSILISDNTNRSVLRLYLNDSNNKPQAIITNVACRGLALDDEGSLYVSDDVRQEVRKYAKNDPIGVVVAGGNGTGAGLDQLHGPLYIALDADGALYISEWNNHRVVKWAPGATKGVVVAGNGSSGTSNTQLNSPSGIYIDGNNNLYVIDTNNKRLVRYPKNSLVSDVLVDSTILKYPFALAFDRHNNLYVTDDSGRAFRFLSLS